MYVSCFSCKDGVFRKYQGARTKDDFLSFIDEQKWKAMEPVSSWFGPSSFLWVGITQQWCYTFDIEWHVYSFFLLSRMNSMSALFKLSMFIRVRMHLLPVCGDWRPLWGLRLWSFSVFQRCHNYMTDQLGIPVWGSYVIFGLATLFSGLALGLVRKHAALRPDFTKRCLVWSSSFVCPLQLLVFIADFVFPSRRFSSSEYHQSKFHIYSLVKYDPFIFARVFISTCQHFSV